jgi:acetylornithine deacetylase/succinyl-diaminopimelate desuccinylase-like protein
LLPGDDPDAAAAEIERVAMQVDGMQDPVSHKPFRVTMTRGPMMHPSLIAIDSAVAVAVLRACRVMLGREPETVYRQSAFDQGYLNHVGIPAANFGPGEERFAHTNHDVASIERSVYAFLIAEHLATDEYKDRA